MKILKERLKKIAFKYLRLGAPNYSYNVEPIQLAKLISELIRLDSTEGNILEVGVARGMTTRFICEHLKNTNFEGTYYAIDTFESFTDRDLDFEVSTREKQLTKLKGFEYNDFNVWKSHFRDFAFLKAVKSDCSDLDYKEFMPIKLAFLDVDLYLPTLKELTKIYECTCEGGVILVDDCMDNIIYDGAFQAYMEFCAEKCIEPKIIGNKCGIIYK
jgi:hypothetical protein